MFPIGRKQALAAQKMQLLQPHLKELQEKYKDDKERLTKETFALYKKHGVNPVAGCLPALIQLPIFVGLWQALNTSFPLRHAPFLWIRDLAAPDMLFRFPFASEVPFLGHWFNVLPFVVVGLMLVQTKLFAPPATTPEAEMQQKMMKYMMIFMGFMFYKVPSGLGLYFITSSMWAIGERLLLPKITHAQPAVRCGRVELRIGRRQRRRQRPATASARSGGGKGNGDGNGAKVKPPGRIAQFMERVLDEARKDPTYRKIVEERDGKSSDRRKTASATGSAPAQAQEAVRLRASDDARRSSTPTTRSWPSPVLRAGAARHRPALGPAAISIVLADYLPDGDQVLPPRRARVSSGSLRVDGLRPLLPVMLALWPAPRTYTGQDVAEIHLVARYRS